MNPLDVGPADRIFGRHTDAAVWASQQASGLAVDEVVGRTPQELPQRDPSNPRPRGRRLCLGLDHWRLDYVGGELD
jgi:peptidoglycan hydrolase-like protein with peptidoglycan-binding domain